MSDADGRDRTRTGGATAVMDALSDGAVLLFAAWTAVYHLGLLLRPPTWVLLAAWAVVAAGAAALYAARSGRRPGGFGPVGEPPLPGGGELEGGAHRAARAARPWLAVVAVAAGIVAGTCAGLNTSGVPWWCAWAPGLVSVTASAVWLLRRSRPASGRLGGSEAPLPGEDADTRELRWGTPLALVTGAGFAVASLFIVNTDGDDAYFVSRSVATAATGRIPLRDVIFTSGTTGPIAGEPPVSSFEVLVGSLARVLGVPASSFLWYAALPAVTFLAVWSLWRLVRAWAPRRAAACFAVGALYLLWSGESSASLGSFHLLRMWQGKAVLVSALIPLLYVYLTRWAERRAPRDLVLLGGAGVAATGLTSSAAFVVPLVVGAAAVPLLAAGRVRTGLAAFTAAAYPVAAGLAVMVLHRDTAVEGSFHDAPVTYQWVLLTSTLGVLAGCAVWLAPWTARRGAPALIVTGVAATLTVVFVPGVLEAAADLLNIGQVLWRTMWTAPVPALIGLLAAVRRPLSPVHALRRDTGHAGLRGATADGGGGWAAGAVAAVPAAALAVAIVAGGTPVWSEDAGSSVAPRPSWKMPADELGTAHAVVREAGRGGVVLMPPSFMRAVPMLTADVHAVNANAHYLSMVPAPPRFIEDRRLLSAAVRAPRSVKPAAPDFRAALTRVGVGVACALPRDRRALALLSDAGWLDQRRVGTLVCAFPPRH